MDARKPRFPIQRQAAARIELTRWERVGGFLLWYLLPAVGLSLVVAYMALAVVWHANPPVVPVLGDSMQPTLHAGDLVLVRGVPPARLRKGDVIAFRVPKAIQDKYDVPGSYVHRIVRVAKTSHGFQYRTKGDNVPGPDPFWTFSENVVGTMVARVPGGGYPILFFRSRQGEIFAIALAAVLLVYFLLGVWERRQEVEESNALTMAQIVEEARALRDSMAGAAGPPRAAGEPTLYEAAVAAGLKMVELEGEPPAGAVLCSRGCHVLLPGALFDPHTGAPVEVLELPFVPIPSSRALVPYVPAGAPTIDFERLEREIHEAVRASAGVQEAMRDLVGAIGEYGEHLRSHTAVVQNLAEATADLQAATAEMRQFLASLTTLLTTLVEQRANPPES